jgi:hypothetical protein
MPGEVWTQQELQLLQENGEALDYKDLVDLLPGRSYQAVKIKCRQLGFRKSNRKYYFNQAYFSELTLENCYYAGFIAADGFITPTENGVGFVLSNVDRNHLETFAERVGYKGVIRNRADGFVYAGFHSVEWVRDLRKHFNITTSKTWTLQPPNLTGDYALAFIVGYIDGDGWIGTQNVRQEYSYLAFQVVGASLPMLEWIRLHLREIYPISRADSIRKRQNHYVYGFIGLRAQIILSHLKSLDIPHLARKWNKVH